MMPKIYAYINYRAYLRACYEAKKTKNPKFSYRVFARLAGFASPNFLKLVMLGQRNLSKDGIGKVASALKLKPQEKKFFETLVYFNQVQTREEKEFYFEQLGLFRAFNKIQRLEQKNYQYLTEWYHVAVRELVLLDEFQEDPTWIAKKLCPDIMPKEAKASLKLLLDLGLLKRDRKQRLRQSSKNIATDAEVLDLSIANYHDRMIALAAESIDARPATRDISSVTVALDEKTYELARQRIQEFRREMNVLLSDCKQPDAVYQLNFQLFGLTDVPWPKK